MKSKHHNELRVLIRDYIKDKDLTKAIQNVHLLRNKHFIPERESQVMVLLGTLTKCYDSRHLELRPAYNQPTLVKALVLNDQLAMSEFNVKELNKDSASKEQIQESMKNIITIVLEYIDQETLNKLAKKFCKYLKDKEYNRIVFLVDEYEIFSLV